MALLTCPGTASAGVTEFSAGVSPGSAPADITAGTDGNLWFTERNAVGSISVTGAITEYRAGSVPGFPWGRMPGQITAGPNSSLWFTVQGTAHAIARLNPATGSVTETRLAWGRKPTGITAGPDGNVWFTEQGARKIGRITPAGVVTEFNAGIASDDLLNDIAAGHDGGLWFTVAPGEDDDDDDDDDDLRSARSSGGPKIGRIDATTGLIQHFTSGLAGAAPDKITAASDGRLYFTDSAAPGAVRRISTSGEIRTYRAGMTPNSRPAGIAEGGDGALWFTASASPGRLGRLWAPTSTITEFVGGSTPGFTSGANPTGISRGPDGNVWFTESAADRIGRVTVPPLADLEIQERAGTGDDPAAAGVLQATIAANSQPTTYFVEYGPGESYGSRSAVLSAGSSAAPVARVVDLPLVSGGTYHARVVAGNGSGQSVSDDVALQVSSSGEILALEPAVGPAGPGVDSGVPAGSPAALALPALGKSVVIRPVSGTVRYKRRGTSGYTPLGAGVSLPVGSLIDTRNGRVSLQSALNAHGGTQTGTFWGGVFQVRQRRRGRGVTDLVLRGGRFSRCGVNGVKAGISALARESGGKRRVVRRLWGKDRHGRFRTHGRDSVATVRGTKWVTTDRCDGTLTKVTEGKVLVRDLRRKRSVLLTAGRAYLARHNRR